MSQMIQILSVAGWVWTTGFLITLGVMLWATRRPRAEMVQPEQQTHS